MWSTQEHYYSGQGVVMVGRRGADGKPKGLRPVGNVSDLKIAIATSVLEHKESTTGARGTDLRLTTELKCSLNFTLENFNRQNLADALRGESVKVAGGSVTAKAIRFYGGMVEALGRVSLSAIAVKQGAETLTAYVDDATPWDYQANPVGGSVRFNDGSALALDKAGEVITAVTVGATTGLAIVNSGAKVGDVFTARGLTGADASFINNVPAVVTAVTTSLVTVALNTSAKVITATGSPKGVYDGMPLTVDYTYADQYQVDALTQGASELYMRFEGLNTAEENSPVVVEVFRFLTDPLKELALISDTVQQFVLEGSVLADTTRMTGSKYFNVSKLN